MATRRIQNRPKAVLQTEQKIAFVLLIFLGFGGIGFGFRSFGSQLYRPIQQQLAKYYTGEDVLNIDNPDAKTMEESKTKDTDKDGLSDYDELYVYRTSPYLNDSDSDGIDDKTEVFGGTDPNCPVGKNCGSTSETAVGEASSPETVLGVIPGTDGIIQSGSVPIENGFDMEKILKSAKPAEIRDALIKSGMSKADVDKISDADIQTLFQEAVAKASSEGKLQSLTTGTTPTTATPSPSKP